MELRHLRYFVSVADGLSFTRAAERLHVSQSSLSVQIAKLEGEIGAPLLARDGRGVALMPAGVVFLKHARHILRQADEGISAARRAASGQTGELVIGHNTAAEFRVFPAVVASFGRQWPDVSLRFRNLRAVQQLDGLRRGGLDLAFIWLPAPRSDFDVMELYQEPLSAVLPADHRLAGMEAVSIAELASEKLISFAPELDPDSFLELAQLFRQAGVEMTVAHEASTTLSAINFVAMGCGCSILPDYTRHLGSSTVVFRPLSPASPVKTLAMLKRRGASGLSAMFFAHVSQAFNTLSTAATP